MYWQVYLQKLHMPLVNIYINKLILCQVIFIYLITQDL